jgi:hypothetical protein
MRRSGIVGPCCHHQLGALELAVLALRQQFEPDFAFGAAKFWRKLDCPFSVHDNLQVGNL